MHYGYQAMKQTFLLNVIFKVFFPVKIYSKDDVQDTKQHFIRVTEETLSIFLFTFNKTLSTLLLRTVIPCEPLTN